ncbi:1-aminocyclopropane-1-carboxylate deaminase/D-cysteine desulfhydrase [Algibacter mikhailovii]|uniref:1-aminocyclopropane-1-carboxylate deaminase n=1 Tax=Algibacter mikhailovii TaxID=425498 RepID=A0A918RCA4_9FLAO|nr:pyridoxal-phosphate dependent enzyme [Algibacter mikhailovii]GGZ91534.1 1-aminocyclopropane-1-carboxylate deaminase [Algibacter mikhailovii]
MIFKPENSIIQPINHQLNSIELSMKREDRIHPFVSGNKYRKLKYNLLEAKAKGITVLLTFGGAFSNHIAAVAAAGFELGFETIGVIRGEELKDKINGNATLKFAKKNGMRFNFVTRDAYRNKTSASFINELKHDFGDFFLIPEGGTNELAVKGCEEVLMNVSSDYDYICCPVGTGGTISGLINCSKLSQQVLGFPALKGDFMQKDISKFVMQNNWTLITDYHFGGYAKINDELVAFINEFKVHYNIPLDPIYTGKMMFGIFDLLKKDYFSKGSKILAIHTGGLQGIEGMNSRLLKKHSPIIIT